MVHVAASYAMVEGLSNFDHYVVMYEGDGFDVVEVYFTTGVFDEFVVVK